MDTTFNIANIPVIILLILVWCIFWGWLIQINDCPQCGEECQGDTRLCHDNFSGDINPH